MNKLLSILFALVILPLPAIGEVVFSDDFEWGSDWNSSQGNTAPIANGWSSITMVNRGGSYEAAYVNSTGAKQGSRGFTQYWDATAAQGSAQDIWLSTAGLTFPDEYYVGYWMKVSSNWDFGSVDSLKIIKTELSGSVTWDIAWLTQGTMIAYCCGDAAAGGLDDWCVVNGTRWTGESNVIASIGTDEAAYRVFGNWSEIDGGEWHYFVWHMKHSTETLELSIDGSDAYQMSANQFPPDSTYSGGVTTTRWNFGGNISDGGGAVNEMSTSYDDLIIATTQAEVLSFLGVTAPPQYISVNSGAIKIGAGFLKLP